MTFYLQNKSDKIFDSYIFVFRFKYRKVSLCNQVFSKFSSNKSERMHGYYTRIKMCTGFLKKQKLFLSKKKNNNSIFDLFFSEQASMEGSKFA